MTAHRVPGRQVRYLLDWGRGIRISPARCIMCGHRWTVIIPIGTTGTHCPACDFFDPTTYWGDPRPALYCDGFWTTGEWVATEVTRLGPGQEQIRFRSFHRPERSDELWRGTHTE